jgi:hypothetical protein
MPVAPAAGNVETMQFSSEKIRAPDELWRLSLKTYN